MTLEEFRTHFPYKWKILYEENNWIIYNYLSIIYLFHLECELFLPNHISPNPFNGSCKEDPSPYILKLYKLMQFTDRIM